jgi:hypothetical protein
MNEQARQGLKTERDKDGVADSLFDDQVIGGCAMIVIRCGLNANLDIILPTDMSEKTNVVVIYRIPGEFVGRDGHAHRRVKE